MLHHQVENIVSSCLESNNQALLDHLFQDCDFVTRLLAADESPYIPETQLEVLISEVKTFLFNNLVSTTFSHIYIFVLNDIRVACVSYNDNSVVLAASLFSNLAVVCIMVCHIHLYTS
jgi:hypothetical protein